MLLRANVPCAIASTLVTNPLTFGPVYVAAWKVGGAVLGASGDAAAGGVRRARRRPCTLVAGGLRTGSSRWASRSIVGLAIFAVVAGVGAYLLVTWAWWARTRWRRWRRLARRGQPASD